MGVCFRAEGCLGFGVKGFFKLQGWGLGQFRAWDGVGLAGREVCCWSVSVLSRSFVWRGPEGLCMDSRGALHGI